MMTNKAMMEIMDELKKAETFDEIELVMDVYGLTWEDVSRIAAEMKADAAA